MKRHLLILLTVLSAIIAHGASAAEPLRVFIRGGAKSHGPNAHEHARFLKDWTTFLAERGMKTDGALDWPTADQLKQTDVLVMYAQDGGNATEEQKTNLGEFTKRGGGLVVIHTAAVSNDPAWWKSVIGGAWVPGKTKWKEGPMDLYYVENQRLGEQHPITKGASNFHLDDEIYYDMDIASDVRVLATSYTPNVPAGRKVAEGSKANIYDIQPQMWAYEKENYRAFVTIPGHLYFTFEKPNYRAILLRGIAWAGKRANVDEFCKKDEIEALTYPEGGPQRPADTLKALEIHPDFNLKLVAAEPLINKPMNFDWDPAGRLWVAETPEYPNGRRGMRPDYRGKEWKDHGGIVPAAGDQERKAIDKISILTDTDGDGVMDKKEVFYEGLDLVTGLVFYKDGVIVTQAPDILWLRDTDHDGKADKVEKLYTNLGTGDTHAVINNPRMGWDGWIYCTHGYSASRDVTSGDGAKHFGPINSGVVRFKPDGSAFEQYSSKGGNTWGLTITGDNRVMWTQPTSGQLLMQTVLPEYALSRGAVAKQVSYKVVEPSLKTFPALTWEQMAYVQIDWVGSFTAAAGCAIYDGGSWPAEYNGDYFTTEPTINIIHHARLTPEGSSYTFHKLPGREQTEFIRSKDMWWRPIETRVGPDGAVYISDFYNQAVIHNDTRGPDHNKVNAAVRPDRDHYFGRIWRLDHKNAQKLSVPDLSKADTATLAKALENPNREVRMTASRLLGDKHEGADAVTAIFKSGNPDAKIAALWTLYRLDSFKEAAQTALSDNDAAVRRNAANVLEAAGQPSNGVLALLSDADGQVRVAALRALAAGELNDESAKAIIAAWPKFNDDFQRSAAIGAASKNPAASIAAALDAADPAPLAPLVGQLTQGIGERNDSAAATKLVVLLAGKPAAADALKRSILDTLGKSLKATPALTPELGAALSQLLSSGASGSALPLAAKWDKAGTLKAEISKLTAGLLVKLNDNTASADARLTVAQSLLGLRSANPEALPAVIKTVTGDAPAALKRSLIVALGETGDPSVGASLSGAFGQLPIEAQSAAFEVLLQRAEWALALVEGIKSKKVDVAGIGPANLARLRTHPDKNVSTVANTALDEIFGPALKAKNEVIAKLTPIVEQPGDAVKGKALFTATCAICHKLGDVGADVGPGLTGMGAHGAAELLTAIVDPNREIDPSFVAWNIETKDGNFHAGVLARENPTALVLKSLAGIEEIKQSDVKSRLNTGRSLMPEGF
ncbi:MAG: putative rane-bound dehydrogenase, partial [Chthoniobacteraceae bacterium]|nr:putative rane-bound dehydrogenase [Chthoniobacteraceae bacterium]